mmetsp:Transcript_11523/g.31915  ORF Transcript_11523/g.31915 Transcript_11523/m.31915 type:complete len:437 (+) Transcript_11523:220-1530(+)|eukprot:CAMPEP_0168756646 /NCGR_PEP_ID=MMETSP0724-20121128/20728_1 /TAXON_ID=265536 /ORGANISM="Amphiprora sp., Strain CCMP467" /LENGTH=436 /DNA_ID=CAMNT_0008805371 /DNA_START=173 /DNA_END=1483 /DNA_ORIENTATION=+
MNPPPPPPLDHRFECDDAGQWWFKYRQGMTRNDIPPGVTHVVVVATTTTTTTNDHDQNDHDDDTEEERNAASNHHQGNSATTSHAESRSISLTVGDFCFDNYHSDFRYDSLQHVKIQTTTERAAGAGASAAVILETIGYRSFHFCHNLITFHVPVRHVGRHALGQCAALPRISLPGCVRLGDFAFRRCSALTTVNLKPPAPPQQPQQGDDNDPKNENEHDQDGSKSTPCWPLEFIGQECFRDCTSLQEMDLGNCPLVTIIPQSAFCNCTALSKLVMPPRLQRLGRAAFARCRALPHVTLPATLVAVEAPSTHSGEWTAFQDCTALTTVTFASLRTVESLVVANLSSSSSSLFQGCTSLWNVQLPLQKDRHEASVPLPLWPWVLTRLFDLNGPHDEDDHRAHTRRGLLLGQDTTPEQRVGCAYSFLILRLEEMLLQN